MGKCGTHLKAVVHSADYCQISAIYEVFYKYFKCEVMSAKLLKSDVITVSVVIASQLLNIAKQHFLSSETTI